MQLPGAGCAAKEDVPDLVIRAYGGESMKFGREYIIPTPLDPVYCLGSAAVAEMAMKTGVARKTIDIDEYREQLAYRQGKGEQVRYFFLNKAQIIRGGKKRVVFAEGEEPKIIRAAYQLKEEGIADPILIGHATVIEEQLKPWDGIQTGSC